MPAIDLYHNALKQALIKDGWIVTHAPLHLRWGRKDMYVDLGAKRLLIAERSEEKIAVEVKSLAYSNGRGKSLPCLCSSKRKPRRALFKFSLQPRLN